MTNKPDELISVVANSILYEHLEVFHHDHQRTWIRTKPGSPFREIESELFSRQSVSWLTYVIHEATGNLISERLAVRICHYIEGSPSNNAVPLGSDLSLSSLVDDPIISTFLLWSEKVMAFPYQSGFADWYMEIRRFRATGGFPRGPSSLSRKLKPLVPSLLALGFLVTLSRNAKGVQVIVDQVGDDIRLHTAQHESSQNNTNQDKSKDDDDAVIRQLIKSQKFHKGGRNEL